MIAKRVRIAGKERLLHGISQDDAYFRNLADDMENEFVDVCRRCIPPDAVCLDIGANIGVKTLALSEIASHGHVYSFEPSPTVYALLALNTAECCRNVETLQIAVSDIDGKVSFHDASAYGHIVTTGGVQVEAMTLASIVEARGLDRLDFIKIDIEGFEFKILKSSLEVLKKFRSVVYFEFNTWCLLAHSRTHPLEFLEWIFDNFPLVGKINRTSSQELVTPLLRQDIMSFLYANIFEDGCVNDLVVAAAMPDFWPGSAQAILQNFRTHNNAVAEWDSYALSFTTPAGQWYYAISIDCIWMSTGATVELEVQANSGVIGFGLVEPALSVYLSDEIFVRPEDGRKKIRISLAKATPHAVLVGRNVSDAGKSQGTVYSIGVINIAPGPQ
jgi:FkbM family methyltransferase